MLGHHRAEEAVRSMMRGARMQNVALRNASRRPAVPGPARAHHRGPRNNREGRRMRRDDAAAAGADHDDTLHVQAAGGQQRRRGTLRRYVVARRVVQERGVRRPRPAARSACVSAVTQPCSATFDIVALPVNAAESAVTSTTRQTTKGARPNTSTERFSIATSGLVSSSRPFPNLWSKPGSTPLGAGDTVRGGR